MKVIKGFLRPPIQVIVVVLATLAFAFTLSGCSGGGASAGVKDGIIELEQAKLDFGANQVPDSSKSTLSVIKLKNGGEPDGLASTLFELYLDVTCDQPVTISIPLTDTEPPVDDQVTASLGLGTKITLEDGSVDTLYSYLPAEVADGMVTSTFIPSQYLEQLSVNGASGSARPSSERLSLGIFWHSSTLTDGGHFVAYFPVRARTYLLDYNDRRNLLSDLEAVYNDYLDKGYTYDQRTDWPMEVHIQSLSAQGYYSYGWSGAAGKIYLNRSMFEEGYQSNKVKPLLAHEFFHFVQLNYVDSGKDLLWFDEATATYFEGQVAGRVPYIVEEYKENIFFGVFPEVNDAANGYARMPLIKYLSQKRGENFILNAYTIAGEGADWDSALLSSTGPPSVWAGDFYEALVKGDVSTYAPYTLHKEIVAGNMKKAATSLALKIPTAEEIATMAAKNEAIIFGSATVEVGPYGAQLVALTIDEKNLSRLDDIDPPVWALGADVRVFAVHGREVNVLSGSGGIVTLKDFKKLSKEETMFLVLVTGLHDSGNQEYTVTVGLPAYPTLDELVGQYPGGSLLFSKVNIPDMAKSSDNSGCDEQTMAMLKGMEGQKLPMTLEITKTGEESGNLVLTTEKSEFSDGGKSLDPYPFTYMGGQLIIDTNIDGDKLTASLRATYGKNKDVVVDGDLNGVTSSGQISLVLHLNGSKPLNTN